MVETGTMLKKGLTAIMLLVLFISGCAGGGSAQRPDKPDTMASLDSIEVKDADTTTTVTLHTNRPVAFSSVKINKPAKMVLDMMGAQKGDTVMERFRVRKGLVTEINIVPVQNAKKLLRVEMTLERAVEARSVQDANGISIIFDKAEAAAAQKTEAKGSGIAQLVKPPMPAPLASYAPQNTETNKSRVAQAAMPAESASQAPVAPKTPAMPEAKNILDIKYAKNGDGFLVTIRGDGKLAKPKTFRLGKDRIVLDFPNTGLTKGNKTIKVSGKCLMRIRVAGYAPPAENVRVVLDLGCPSEYEARPEGDTYVIAVAPKGSKYARLLPSDTAVAAAVPSEQTVAPKAAEPATPKKNEKDAGAGHAVIGNVTTAKIDHGKSVKINITKKKGTDVIVASANESDSREASSYVETETSIYTGGKISFDVQDLELSKVIKLLADVAGLNLIMDPADVSGKVTLKLDDVPWDQALDILLKLYNLDKTIEGNVMRVAGKAKMDDERSRVLQMAKTQKQMEQNAAPLINKTIKINFTTAAEMVEPVKKILTARGDVTPNTRTNELVVNDIQENIDKIEQLVKNLDKEVNQIMIEARIVTVDVTYAQSLGLSWGLNRNAKNGVLSIASGTKYSLTGTSGTTASAGTSATNPSYAIAVPAALKDTTGGVAAALGGWTPFGLKNVNIDLTLEALESIGKAEKLSSPRVMTLENQAATITSGTTLYVQTTSATGTAPAPLNANLSLTVTPRVTGDNFIMMDVVATDNGVAPVPAGSTAAIDTKSVTTKVMVKNGDTVVLGGIYVKIKNKNDTGIPYLNRIPILGWLFKERDNGDETHELLIFITPKLMKTNPSQV